jgi:Uma2 family endonuclease
MPEGAVVKEEVLSEYELERGKPMPNFIHAHIELNIGTALRERYRKTHSVVVEVTVQFDRPLTPDVAVFAKRPIDFSDASPKETQIPMLAIEIASPSQPLQTLIDKATEMLRFGVKAVWIVQPTLQTVSVFTSAATPKTFTDGVVSDGVSGIELSIDQIFSAE